MDLTTFMNYIQRLYDGDILSEEEIKSIDLKASEIIDLMKNEEVDFDTKNAVDLYINYYDDSRYLDNEKKKNIMNYYRLAEEKNNQRIMNDKAKSLELKRINSDGVISAIAVIEAAVIGGMLIAFLAIALLGI